MCRISLFFGGNYKNVLFSNNLFFFYITIIRLIWSVKFYYRDSVNRSTVCLVRPLMQINTDVGTGCCGFPVFSGFFAKYPLASTSAFRKRLFPGYFFSRLVIFSDQDKLPIMRIHPTFKFIFVCLH